MTHSRARKTNATKSSTANATNAMLINVFTPVDSINAHTSTSLLTSVDSIDAHTSTSPTPDSPSAYNPPASPPSPVRPLRKRSSSSSSEEYHALSLTMNMSSTGTTAVLSLNNGKHPMILVGAMTPELLHRFEHHARGYLQNKDGLCAKDFVDHIIYSFKTLYSRTGTNHNKTSCLPSLSSSSWARSVRAGCLNDGNRISHRRFTRRNR
jgi:hypothetical protein